MPIVVFMDLDDTLFQTATKAPDGSSLDIAAVDREGKPISFITSRQKQFFHWLDTHAIVIPTTARNTDAYRRVQLRFRHGAIVSFGAVILDENGVPNSKWMSIVRPQIEMVQNELNGLEEDALESCVADPSVRVRLVREGGLAVYLVAKSTDGDASKLQHLDSSWRQLARKGSFFVHFNGNNLSLVPDCLGKEKAVRFVCEELFQGSELVTIGIGDSLTDASFMSSCHFVMMPRHSQIFESLLSRRMDV
jgi:hypothetical protein